jgi:hypothetical protein
MGIYAHGFVWPIFCLIKRVFVCCQIQTVWMGGWIFGMFDNKKMLWTYQSGNVDIVEAFHYLIQFFEQFAYHLDLVSKIEKNEKEKWWGNV